MTSFWILMKGHFSERCSAHVAAMTCTVHASPAKALVGWLTPVTAGRELPTFPSHRRWRSGSRSDLVSSDTPNVTAWRLPNNRRAVATASLASGAAAGAPRKGSGHKFSNCIEITNRKYVATWAVTDPQAHRGAEDDEEDATVGEKDGANRGRRDKTNGATRRPASVSPPRRRNGTSDADMRKRAARYGRERERLNTPRRMSDTAGGERDTVSSSDFDTSPRAPTKPKSAKPMRDRRRAYLDKRRAMGRENKGNARSVSPRTKAFAGEITERFENSLAAGDLDACVFDLASALRLSHDEDKDEGERWVGADFNSDTRSSVKVHVGRSLGQLHKRFLTQCAAHDPPRTDLTLRYARALPPDSRLYASVLGACARGKDFESACRVFEMYKLNGLAPDVFAYAGIISAAGKAGKLNDASALLRRAVSDLGDTCDVGVYNAFIDACARVGDVTQAQSTCTQMRQRNSKICAPNTRTYNSIITAAARARDFSAAKTALHELELDQILEPTDVTFGAALAAAATSEPSSANIQWAIDTYDRFTRLDTTKWHGNNHAASSLLTVLARGVAAKEWPAEEAVRRAGETTGALVACFATATPKKTPNAAVWSAHMSVCARAGRAREAMDALSLMRECGSPLDAYTLASALTACRGDMGQVSHLSSTFDEESSEGGSSESSTGMHSNGSGRSVTPEALECLLAFERADVAVSSSVAVKNAAIALYAHFGFADKAFETYESMRATVDGVTSEESRAIGDGVTSTEESEFARGQDSKVSADDTSPQSTPDTITYNTLIAACASSDRPERALELHNDMVETDVPRSLRTYVGLMAAASRAADEGNGAAAAKHFFEIAQRDETVESKHNAFTYTALIDAQVKAGDACAAFNTFEDMKKANVQPTVVTFGCLLNACRMATNARGAGVGTMVGDAKDRDQSSADTTKDSTTPSDTFTTTDHSVHMAYDLLHQMANLNIRPNGRCQNALVRVVSEAGRVDDALDEVKKIARSGGTFERDTLEVVVVALCRAEYADRALRIVGWMDVRGYVCTPSTYMALTRACCAEGSVMTAWQTHCDAFDKTRESGVLYKPDRATISALILSLCRAALSVDSQEAVKMTERAIGVYEDACSNGVAREGEHPNETQTSSSSPVGQFCPIPWQGTATDSKRTSAAKTSADQILTPAAARALVSASARCGQRKFALSLYRSEGGKKALRLYVPSRASDGVDKTSNDDRRVLFESLIETSCHENDVNVALEVFDTLKEIADVTVSKVTLAFLESVCRRSKVPEYRVFDVCATMRQQTHNKKEKQREKPEKKTSHHVFGSVELLDELLEQGLSAGQYDEYGEFTQ